MFTHLIWWFPPLLFDATFLVLSHEKYLNKKSNDTKNFEKKVVFHNFTKKILSDYFFLRIFIFSETF